MPPQPTDTHEHPHPDWRTRAACIGHDPEIFFPVSYRVGDRTAQVARAKAICAGCPVRAECLDDAIRGGDVFAIRGATLPVERRAGVREAAHRHQGQTAHRAAAGQLPEAARAAVDGSDRRGTLPPGVSTHVKRVLLRAGLAQESLSHGISRGSSVRLNAAGRELAAARRAQLAGAAR